MRGENIITAISHSGPEVIVARCRRVGSSAVTRGETQRRGARNCKVLRRDCRLGAIIAQAPACGGSSCWSADGRRTGAAKGCAKRSRAIRRASHLTAGRERRERVCCAVRWAARRSPGRRRRGSLAWAADRDLHAVLSASACVRVTCRTRSQLLRRVVPRQPNRKDGRRRGWDASSPPQYDDDGQRDHRDRSGGPDDRSSDRSGRCGRADRD